jgi:hypothetical protein
MDGITALYLEELKSHLVEVIVVASAGNEGGTSNPHIGRQPMQYLYYWRC